MNNRSWLALVAAIGPLLGVAPAASAQSERTMRCDRQMAGSAVVHGRLLVDSTGPVRSRAVRLRRVDGLASCGFATDSAGVFRFDGIDPGAYELEIAPLGFATMSPLALRVQPNDTVLLDVPVFRSNGVDECLRHPTCAAVISRVSAGEARPDDPLALELLALRTSIAMALYSSEAEPWVACVEASAEVLAMLRTVYAEVAPAEECTQRDPRDRTVSPMGRIEHSPTGRRARRIRRPEVASVTENEATYRVGYTSAALGGAGHDCVAVLEAGRWIARVCRLTWVS